MSEYLIKNLKGRDCVVLDRDGIPVLEVPNAKSVELEKYIGNTRGGVKLFTDRIIINTSEGMRHQYSTKR